MPQPGINISRGGNRLKAKGTLTAKRADQRRFFLGRCQGIKFGVNHVFLFSIRKLHYRAMSCRIMQVLHNVIGKIGT